MRWMLWLVMAVTLVACDSAADLKDAPVPLGDFNLEHNIVIAPNAFKGPLSRAASTEELTSTLKGAIAERFDRYNGSKRYHFGVSVEGYVLAQPGVPLVLSPKSVLIINVTVWDDAAGKKLNDKPKQITVLESFGGSTLVGSGYTLSAQEQLTNLSQNAAKAIERYLLKQNEELGWFEGSAVPTDAES